MSRPVPYGYTFFDVQKLSVTSIVTQLNTTVRTAKAILLSVETTNARVGFNTTVPKTSTGVLLQTGNGPYWFDNLPLSTMRFCSISTAASLLQIEAFKGIKED